MTLMTNKQVTEVKELVKNFRGVHYANYCDAAKGHNRPVTFKMKKVFLTAFYRFMTEEYPGIFKK